MKEVKRAGRLSVLQAAVQILFQRHKLDGLNGDEVRSKFDFSISPNRASMLPWLRLVNPVFLANMGPGGLSS